MTVKAENQTAAPATAMSEDLIFTMRDAYRYDYRNLALAKAKWGRVARKTWLYGFAAMGACMLAMVGTLGASMLVPALATAALVLDAAALAIGAVAATSFVGCEIYSRIAGRRDLSRDLASGALAQKFAQEKLPSFLESLAASRARLDKDAKRLDERAAKLKETFGTLAQAAAPAQEVPATGKEAAVAVQEAPAPAPAAPPKQG